MASVEITDFGNSYMTWVVPADPTDKRVPGHKPWGNSARILLDARCTIIDSYSGSIDQFYLIAPCRTEWMYQDADLFQIPSGEYREIFSTTRRLSLARRLTSEGEPLRSQPIALHTAIVDGQIRTAGLTALDFTIRTWPTTTKLDTDATVIAATQANLPLVGQTEIWYGDSPLRATLEYPIKTMNIQPERQRFQVDTGPLIMPDLTSNTEHWIDRCLLAHIIYNRFDQAEFICRQPTPIERNGAAVASVLEYSAIYNYSARTILWCAGELQSTS